MDGEQRRTVSSPIDPGGSGLIAALAEQARALSPVL